MICTDAIEPGRVPPLSLEKLQKAIPEINWTKGHSGELLSDEVVIKLNGMNE